MGSGVGPSLIDWLIELVPGCTVIPLQILLCGWAHCTAVGALPSRSAVAVRLYTWSTTVFGWVVHVKGVHLNARTEGFRAEHIILTRWWSYLLCLLVFLLLWLIGVYRLFNLKVVLVNRRHCRGLKCHQIQLKNSKNSNGDSIIQIYFSLKWKYFVHYQRISLYSLYRICYLTHNSI